MKSNEDKKNEIKELEGNKQLINELLQAYAEETTRLKLLSKANKIEVNNVVQATKTVFDLTIQCDSLLDFEKDGWPVRFAKQFKSLEEYNKLNSIDCITVSVLGNKGTGKTFFLSHIANTVFESDSNYHKSLQVKFPTSKSICYIDTNFTNYPLIQESNEDLNLKNHIFTEDFLTNFVISESNCIFYLVDIINGTNQKLIETIKTKIDHLLTENKKLFFIHNLQSLTTVNEVNKYFNEVLQKTFNLTENNIFSQNENQSISNENCFFTEPDRKYIHYIIGKRDTDSGALYNEKVIKHIQTHIQVITKKTKFDILRDFTNYFQNNAQIYFTNSKGDQRALSLNLIDNKCFELKQKGELIFSEKALNEFRTQLIKTDIFYPKYNVTKDNKNNKLKISINIPSEKVNETIDKKIIKDEIWFKIKGKYEPIFGGSEEKEICNTIQTGNFEINFSIPVVQCNVNVNDKNYQKSIKNGFLCIQFNCLGIELCQKIECKDEDD